MMMIDSEVPSWWYTVASVYKPTLEHHRANDKLLLRICKRTTGFSRYAKTHPIWAPRKDFGMGLMQAATRHVVAVQREWIRHYGSCKPYFREGLLEYLKVIHKHYGGCPAVLLPHQKNIRVGPHVWACLQHVVTQVDLPMWLPGTCSKKSHILVKHRASAHAMAGPEELGWETEYGPVRAVKIPHNVFIIMTVSIGVHHLEDLIEKDGDWVNTFYGFRSAGASVYHIDIFKKWFPPTRA